MTWLRRSAQPLNGEWFCAASFFRETNIQPSTWRRALALVFAPCAAPSVPGFIRAAAGGNNCYAVFCAGSTLTPISAAKTALLFPQTAARRSTISLPAVFSVLMLRVCAPSNRCAGAGFYPPWSSLPSAGWAFICGGIRTILESILSKISRSWERSWRITPSCARSTAWRASAWANSRSDWTLPQWQLRHELRRRHAGWAFSFQHHRLYLSEVTIRPQARDHRIAALARGNIAQSPAQAGSGCRFGPVVLPFSGSAISAVCFQVADAADR